MQPIRHARVRQAYAHVLRTPTETRRAIAYVRNNQRKHMATVGKPLPARYVDAFSSDGAGVVLPFPRSYLFKLATAPP